VPIEDGEADDDAEPGRPTHARDHVVIDPTNL
jgi:hypothetical protein